MTVKISKLDGSDSGIDWVLSFVEDVVMVNQNR
jgi:hypothetical protein